MLFRNHYTRQLITESVPNLDLNRIIISERARHRGAVVQDLNDLAALKDKNRTHGKTDQQTFPSPSTSHESFLLRTMDSGHLTSSHHTAADGVAEFSYLVKSS